MAERQGSRADDQELTMIAMPAIPMEVRRRNNDLEREVRTNLIPRLVEIAKIEMADEELVERLYREACGDRIDTLSVHYRDELRNAIADAIGRTELFVQLQSIGAIIEELVY